MRLVAPLVLASVLVGATVPAMAAEMSVSIEVPTLKVAEYHRPYVAVWVEGEDASLASHLAVWYDVKLKNSEGLKWLKDLRQWWRRGGRGLDMPVDGVSGATRAAGTHTLSFTEGKAPLNKLAAGNYKLVVEAAREVGGRETVNIPFQWPPKKGETLTAKGTAELGSISLELKP